MSSQQENDRKTLLKNALIALNEMQSKLDAMQKAQREPVAIIGMGCRFPGGADSPEAYWNLLHNGVNAVRAVPPERWDVAAFNNLDVEKPVAWFGGFLDQIDQFDPQFFGISPREANNMDPQQRLALEVAWEALENAALPPEKLSGSQTGVFVGVTTNDYGQLVRLTDPAQMDVYAATGSALNVISGRLAYLLGLHGPCVSVDTACSSSLVAIHLACRSLRSHECDMALAGGVNTTLTPEPFVCFSGWGMMAPDGLCKTFDARADGFVRGEGCGMIVLKRLSDALADGDRILAVIRGSAVNQDGRSSGLTVPSGRAQQTVIRTALKDAGVLPSQVSYVEAHGTGTSLGDPIEVEALGIVLGEGRPRDLPLVIGSVKTNIGHLKSASGIAGLIKVVLAMRNQEIPPHLHLQERSSSIPWPDFPVEIPTQSLEWLPGSQKRIAGISSFGFSGTNAHLIIEEAPAEPSLAGREEPVQGMGERSVHLLAVSAKSPQALAVLAGRYARQLASQTDVSLQAVCKTAATGRSQFAHRLALTGSSRADFVDALTAIEQGSLLPNGASGQVERGGMGKIAFLFTGQGSQWVGMGQQLYNSEPVFRQALDACDEILRAELDQPLLSVLFDPTSDTTLLDHTSYTQPALFSLQYALVQLWKSWGIEPAAVLGHSVGEYAAACAAGVFSLQDGLRLIAARARLMGALPPGGGMAAVMADETQVQEVLAGFQGALSTAAFNEPESIVISGAEAPLRAALEIFAQRGIQTQMLKVSHAFHSPLMDVTLDPFEAAAQNIRYHLPTVTFISNVTGQQETSRVTSAAYWRQHIRQPVRFYQGIQALYDAGCRVFIEIGPAPVLSGMGRRCLTDTENNLLWLPSLRKSRGDLAQILESVGTLWVRGANVNWKSFTKDLPGGIVDLPTHPFLRERYWLTDTASQPAAAQPAQASMTGAFLTRRLDYAAQEDICIWEGEVSGQQYPYLLDHCIQSTAILPASAYVEIALEAARQQWGNVPLVLTEIDNRKIMVLGDNRTYQIQIVFNLLSEGEASYKIFSRLVDDTQRIQWTLNHTGHVRIEPNLKPAVQLDIAAFRERCTVPVSAREFYEQQHLKGNQWGPAFQGIRQLWKGEGEALSQVGDQEGYEHTETVFHPALADASGHVLVAAADAFGRKISPDGAFVGGAIDEIRFYRSPQSSRVWAHAEVTPDASTADNILVGTVRVWDEAGNLVSETIGAHLYYLDIHAQQALVSTLDDWFYQSVWEADSTRKDAPVSLSAQQTWLIFADREGIGAELAEKLREAGVTTALVYPEEVYAKNNQHVYHIHTQQVNSWKSTLQVILQDLQQAPTHLVYLWGLDAAGLEKNNLEDIQTAQHLTCENVLLLVQALKQVGISPRLWLTTRQGQPVEQGAFVEPTQSLLWGFGRSLSSEHPELWGGLIDLDAASSSSENAVCLFEAIRQPGSEDLLAFRAASRYIPRLRHKRITSQVDQIVCREDGAYLVTGGFGGLGLLAAQRIAARGAKHILLIGRSGIPDEAAWESVEPASRLGKRIAQVRLLKAAGTSVYPYVADVGNQEQMHAVLNDFHGKTNLPILGVIHAAGVPQYKTIQDQTVEEMRAILQPKVSGAWTLHTLLKDEPLDFFVLYSSASTLISSPFAASYAAGNAFLDGLAYFRKAKGLPALSINWGFWDEVGMVADFTEGRIANQSRAMKFIMPEQGLRALELAFHQDSPQLGIFPADWRLMAQTGEGQPRAFLSELINTQSGVEVQGAHEETLYQHILQASAEVRPELVRNHLYTLIARVFRLPVEKLIPSEPIANLGLDSLMALEIKNSIANDLHVTIPIMQMLKGPVIGEICDEVLEKIAENLLSQKQSPKGEELRSVPEIYFEHEETPLIYPQSYNQRAMWFTNLLDPSSAAYNVSFSARVRSTVDVSSLERALLELMRRHPVLRTTYQLDGEEPVQVIGAQPAKILEIIDASAWGEQDLHEQVQAAYRLPFDLANGPLLRVSLFTAGPEDHVLLIVAHHIAMDGWSVGILLNELEALYSNQGSFPLPEKDYTDFIRWQHSLIDSPEGKQMEAYWLKTLAGELPNMAFPHPANATENAAEDEASFPFVIERPLSDQIRSFARAEDVTLFMTLLSAFQIMLMLYTQQEDILVGCPVSGRSQTGFEGIIGNFINMVVMRSRLTSSHTFRQVLNEVREVAIQAMQNQDYPFPLLVERMGIPRVSGKSPIFQVMLDFQRLQGFERLAPLFTADEQNSMVSFGGLVLTPYYLPQQEGQYTLALQIAETGSTFSGVLKYSQSQFDAPSIQKFQKNLFRLIEKMVANPSEPIPDTSFLLHNMNLNELIAHLQKLDIQITVDQGKLKINAPSGVLTPALQAELIRHKPALINLLTSASDFVRTDLPAIQPANLPGNLPLSFSQQRLFFLNQFNPNDVAYMVTFVIAMNGSLNLPVLEQSIAEIIRRHDSLRTNFVSTAGKEPYQVIRPFDAFTLPVINLSNEQDETIEDKARENIISTVRTPFRLAIDPLFRMKIYKLAENQHWLMVNMHHIVSDGWSATVFINELQLLYTAYLMGKASPLPDLAIQYTDYAVWQQNWLRPETMRSKLDYWKQKLKGSLPVLELPTDYPRPAFQTNKGANYRFSLPMVLLERLKQLAKRDQASLFMVMLAAYKVLLFRYSGQEDMIVGTPVANRAKVETEDLIGLFVNTLALRSDLSGNPTFDHLLAQIRGTALEAFSNQDVPFEMLVQEVQPERSTSHTPIFQVFFILQNIPFQSKSMPGVDFELVMIDNKTAKFDLTLEFYEEVDGSMMGGFEYDTELFKPATIELMAQHFLTLLESFCGNPQQTIGEAPLLAEAERRQILQDWNDTQANYPREMGIQQLFEAQVERTPDAIAVTFGDHSITFGELNHRANCLARHLKDLGAEAETLVGICLNRSIDMVVGLLGILKAGGAYIPLDPAFPVDRLRYMLEDSGARLLLTETALVELLPTQNIRKVCIDRDWAVIALCDGKDLASTVKPDQLAYVLYTSGSTGRPKGVQVTQRNVVNFLTSMQRQPGISAEDVLLSVTTLSFDISGLELYLPLITGARLVLVSSATAADGTQLWRAIEQSGTTIMQATPATWRLLLAAGWQGSQTLKILCGGEAFPADLAASLVERCGSLWNMYGPTETTIWSTASPIRSKNEIITIGRPIANTRTYVLNEQRQPVPVGVPGELYIGGDGVSRGYLNRPELTSEKFLADPFVEDPHARMYRTGDLVRYLPDGNILFLGRIDNQVKVRGFRIELGEIETVLARHPAVRQAVVIAREDTPGDKRLVAYLTAYPSAPAPTISDLRLFLKEHLPDYMIPAIFVTLAALPLTPNGKVDRKSLPAPETNRPELGNSFSPPRNEVERMLASIWQEKLRLEKVGIDDNFFELGGHSLLMVQIHNLICQQFNYNLTIAEMFQYPTIQSLAQRLQQQSQPEDEKVNQQVLERARMQKAALERQRRSERPGNRGGSER